jgi:hypothetical protein
LSIARVVGETPQLASVNARLNLGRGTVLVDPVEQELGSYRELLAGLAEERSIRVESGAHKLTLSLSAAVNVLPHRLHDLVVFGEIFALRHSGP